MNSGRISQPCLPEGVPHDSGEQPLSNDDVARSRNDGTKTIALIEAVAEAKNRNLSMVALARFVAEQFPHSTVRCGIGSVRMRRLFDSHLGWLSPASEIFRQAELMWDEDSKTVPTKPNLPKQPAPTSPPNTQDGIRLNIDDDRSLGRCVLWIEEAQVSTADRVWLRRALPTLRALLWTRGGGLWFHLSRLVSGSVLSSRVYVGLATLFVLLLAMWPVSYRVRCKTVVRPKQSRIIAAPFDATLQSAHVAPGDHVRKGDVLISLEGRPLRLELASIEAQIGQARKEADMASFAGRVAESQQAKLRIREFQRRQDLLSSRLQRLSVTSPIDGIVVLGDLNRSIGAPLTTGQAVMEIAPLDQMVIELEVPEYEIGYVEKGTVSRIRLSAAGGDLIESQIDTVYPSAELRDDANVFIARVEVSNSTGKLRPGMRGDAIAYGPIRPWLWSLTRAGWEKVLWWIGY